MEFPFSVADCIGAPPSNDDEPPGPVIGMLDDRLVRGRQGSNLAVVLEALGKNSAIAQGLKKPVTFGSPHLIDQRIYLMAEGNVAYGFLKVGPKRLFVEPPPANGKNSRVGVQEAFVEINPLCALDFYVHETCQRHGYGRKIFEGMLAREGVQPTQMAYDRPSPKLLGFLRKHYGLTRFRPQNNNYVVFDDYFEASRQSGHSAGRGRASPVADAFPLGRSSSFSSSTQGRCSLPSQREQFADAARPCAVPHGGGFLGDAGHREPFFGEPANGSATIGGCIPRGPSSGNGSQSAGSRQGYVPGQHGATASPAAIPRGLATPWGTDANYQQSFQHGVPAAAASCTAGRNGIGADLRRALGQGAGFVAEQMPAGMRPGGDCGRASSGASSVPSVRGESRGSRGAAGLASGGGGASNRYESPLSHAGHRMVQR